MRKWNVLVSYWCGFTRDQEWMDETRAVFEAEGWTDIRFGNSLTPDYVPWSSNFDGDEITFVVQAESLDREAVQRVLERVGIQHTAYTRIEECQPT